LGRPLGQPERDKARSIVSESGAIERSTTVARRYAEQAVAVCGASTGVVGGFTTLAHALVDTLPVG
jgi:hypothetical protein